MHTLKNKLTNLLSRNRTVFNPVDGTAHGISTEHAHMDREDNELESQEAANDHSERPDWFQAIHDTDYYID